MKSQLDLTLFGVGVPSNMMAHFHYLKPQLLLVNIGEWSALSSSSEVHIPSDC